MGHLPCQRANLAAGDFHPGMNPRVRIAASHSPNIPVHLKRFFRMQQRLPRAVGIRVFRQIQCFPWGKQQYEVSP